MYSGGAYDGPRNPLHHPLLINCNPPIGPQFTFMSQEMRLRKDPPSDQTSSLPPFCILRILPSLCLAVAMPFLGLRAASLKMT